MESLSKVFCSLMCRPAFHSLILMAKHFRVQSDDEKLIPEWVMSFQYLLDKDILGIWFPLIYAERNLESTSDDVTSLIRSENIFETTHALINIIENATTRLIKTPKNNIAHSNFRIKGERKKQKAWFLDLKKNTNKLYNLEHG